MKDYARYSGMAAELFGLLIVLVLIGRYFDQKMGNPKYYITALLALTGVVGYLVKVYYQLVKSNKK